MVKKKKKINVDELSESDIELVKKESTERIEVLKEENDAAIKRLESLMEEARERSIAEAGEELGEDDTIVNGNPVNDYQPKGLNEKVDNLLGKIDVLVDEEGSKEKKKLVKIPRKVRSKLKKLGKKDMVIVFLLKTNRSIDVTVTTVKNGLILINGKVHNCTTDFVYLYQGKYPTIVLCEWDLQPVGTKDYYDAVKDHRSSDAQEVIVRMLEAQQAKGSLPAAKLNLKYIVIIALVALVVGFVIFNK